MKMKTILAVAALTSSVFILSACTSSESIDPINSASANEIVFTEAEVQSQVSTVLKNYYTASIKGSEELNSKVDTLGAEIENIIGTDNMEMLNNSEDPFTDINKVPEDKLKELADYYKSIDPVSGYYDYSGMTDGEIVILCITDVISSNYIAFSSLLDSTPEITIDSSQIVFASSTSAVAPFSSLTWANGSDDYSSYLYSGMDSLTLNYVDGAWKISGKQAYNSYMNTYLSVNANTSS